MRKALLLVSTFLLLGCPSDDINEDDPAFQEITYELLSFTFTPQTDTEEESLSYEIEFFNDNAFGVNGYPLVTIRAEGLESTSRPNADCSSIPANGSCVLSYFVMDDDPELFPSTPVEFVRAEYFIEE